MPAKLIFYKSPQTGEESFNLCPLVKAGCKDCFLPPRCKGEDEMWEILGAFDLIFIPPSKTPEFIRGDTDGEARQGLTPL